MAVCKSVQVAVGSISQLSVLGFLLSLVYSHHDVSTLERKHFSQQQKHFWAVITSIAHRHIYVIIKMLEK